MKHKSKTLYEAPMAASTLLQSGDALLGASFNIALQVEVDEIRNMNAITGDGAENFDIEF